MKKLSVFLMSTISVLLFIAGTGLAQETPQDTAQVCKRYSNQYGVSRYPDQNQIYQTRYYIEQFVDDKFAQLIGIRYCLNEGGLLFKGFEVRFQKSNGVEIQKYGTMDDPTADANNCTPSNGQFLSVDSDIINFAVYVDSNDVEGLLFDLADRTRGQYRANYPVFQPNPPVALNGRPIGFRIEFGHTAVDALNTPNQLMKVQFVYNECICPSSRFLGSNTARDLEVTAVIDVDSTQEIPFQVTEAERLYGQNCGAYTITISPPQALITLASKGGVYTDQMIVQSTTVNDVGIYDLTMEVQQILANGDGYSKPDRGILAPVSYSFQLIVNPCILDDVIKSPVGTEVYDYTIGEPDLTFGPFAFAQSPSCGYEMTIVIDKPDFVEYDETSKTFTVRKTGDSSLIDSYTITVENTYTWRTDVSLVFLTESRTDTITYQLNVSPCQIDGVSTSTIIVDQKYNIGEPGFDFGSFAFSVDSDEQCIYQLEYELLGGSINLSLDEADRSLSLAQSSDPNLRGEYLVEIRGFIEVSDNQVPPNIQTYEDKITFTLVINPCQIDNFELSSDVPAVINYKLGEPGFFFAFYTLIQEPQCGYAQTLSVSGVPLQGFLKHLIPETRFEMTQTSDTNDVGSYTITVQARIEVPVDATSSATQFLTSQFEFELRVNPCFVETFEFSTSLPTIEDITYQLGEPSVTFGRYGFQQSPNCNYEEILTVTNLPDAFVTHNLSFKQFGISSTLSPDFLGTFTITIESAFSQPNYQGGQSTIKASTSFILNVVPCVVTSFDITQTIGNQNYVLDTNGFTFGPYKFVQQPNCEYTQTETLQNFPSTPYLTHDQNLRTFTVTKTDDGSFLGLYDVTVNASYNQLNQDGSTRSVSKSIQFRLTVGPCTVDQFNVVSPAIAESLFYTLDDPGFSIGSYEFAQQPNCNYEQTYSFTNLPDPRFFKLDQAAQTMAVVQSVDSDLLAVYEIEIKAQFLQPNIQGSPTVVSETISFTLIVGSCTVKSFLAASELPTIEYTLGGPPTTYGPYQFSQSPNCGYPTTIAASGLPLSTFLTHDTTNRRITIKNTDDPDFVGVYDVTIESVFLQPEIGGSEQRVAASFSFQIRVSPCTVQTFLSILAPIGTVSYTLGNPSFSFGRYEFEQKPNCNYDQTVTIQNLPEPFVTHDLTERRFELESTLDQQWLKTYNVVIQSEFMQPKIVGESIAIRETIEYTLVVNPCQVTDLISNSVIDPISYTLGAESISFGPYSFSQSPECGYEQQIQIINLPSFVNHLAAQREFELPRIEDQAQVGFYEVTIQSKIYEPVDIYDPQNSSFKELSSEMKFQLTVVNPCETSVLEPFSVANMTTSVKGPAEVQKLELPKDSVSLVLGDKSGLSYCGARQFSIVSTGHEQFLSYSPSETQLTMLSNNDNDIGAVTVTIESYLVDYPNVKETFIFAAIISSCKVLSLQPVPNLDQVYEVNANPLTFSVNQFEQVPDCQAQVQYTIELSSDGQNYIELPGWIQRQDLELSVQTDDFDLLQSYRTRVTAVIEKDPQITASTIFRLDVSSEECEEETVTTDQQIASFVYEINVEQAKQIDFTWITTGSQFLCPFDLSIEVIERNDKKGISAPDQIYDFDNQIGSLTIEATDFTYHGVQWTFKVTKTSLLSKTTERSASYEVDVEFKDLCYESVLKPPQFLQKKLVFDLFQTKEFFFQDMENLSEGPTFCRGFTYDLLYVSGEMSNYIVFQDFQIEAGSVQGRHKVIGNPMDKSWIGSHSIVVLGTNGVQDDSPSARGRYGLFESVMSVILEIEVRDPCLSTVINQDRAFRVPQSFEAPLGQTEYIQNLIGPTDSVSASFGNGYNLCGPRSYTIYAEDDSLYTEDIFSVTKSVNQTASGADQVQLQLKTFERGPTITQYVKVVVKLVDYPENGSISFPIKLEYRLCSPVKFEGASIERQVIMVGDQGYSIYLPFNQFPCIYQMNYSAFIVEKDTLRELPLPSFMSLRASTPAKRNLQANQAVVYNTAELEFFTTTLEDIGEYQVRIYSQLDNFYSNSTTLGFTVRVFEPKDIDWSTTPLFEVSLVNQIVKVGQTVRYAPNFVIEENGWQFQLNVNLGRSNKFAKYDSVKREFVTVANLVEQVDIGPHQVIIEARFTHENGQTAFYRDQFFFLVQDNSSADPGDEADKPDGTWFPPISIDARDNLVPEILDEEGPSRPQPYIARLTETGLLTIGWDRRLQPPAEFKTIPDKKIQVIDYSAFSEDEIEERLEFGWYSQDEDVEAIRVALISALEVRIKRQDPDSELAEIDFSWDILNYSDRYLEIQLDIKNPERIAEDFGRPDLLSVTFWGTEYFKSTTGQEVQYGSQISIGILRQLNPKDAENLDSGLVYIKAYIIAIVLIAVAFFSFGSLLPMWMFVNSLQIITHSTLLNTMMPGNVHYVFKEYLDLLRLNWPLLNNALFDRYNFRIKGYEQGFYNVFLEASDYVHLFAQNMVIISFVGTLILLVWIGLAIKDHLGTKPRFAHRRFFRKQHEPWANNFALRFFYEVFLEMCLCVLINIAIVDFDDFSTGVQWLTSVLVAVAITCYLLWLVSLFYCYGPFLEGFYVKGTYLESFWMARPIKDSFNSVIQLKKQKKKQARAVDRAKVQEKKAISQRLTIATQKIVPIDLNLLGTDRPMMSERDLNASFKDDQEMNDRLSMSVDDKDLQSEADDECQNQQVMNENDVYMPTVMSTHANFRTDRSHMMPPINELDSEREMNSGQKVKESPVFGNELLQTNQSKDDRQALASIMDFDHSLDSHQNTMSRRLDNQNESLERSHGQGNSLIMNGIANQNTDICPSRAESNRFETRLAFNVPLTIANNIGEKGNTPSMSREVSLTLQKLTEGRLNEQQEHIQSSKQYLEDQSLGLHPQINPSTLFSMRSQQSSRADQQLDDQPLMTKKRISIAYETPAFPSQVGLNSRRQSDQVTSPLERFGSNKQEEAGPYSEMNSDQIRGLGAMSKLTQHLEGGEDEGQTNQVRQTTSQSAVSPRLGDGMAALMMSPSKSLYLRSPVKQNQRQHSPYGKQNQKCSPHSGSNQSPRTKKRSPRKPVLIKPTYRYFKSQKVNQDAKNAKIQVVVQKTTHEQIIEQTAKEMLAGAELIPRTQRVKTLHYGLKLNHPRNVALVHPLLYTLRRVVYALAIVFLAGYPLFGVWIVLSCTLVMIAFGLMEHPWKDPLINAQNIKNEFMTYLVCIFLLLFNGFVSTWTRHMLGYALIGLISIFIVYNGVIMMRRVTRLIKLLIRKWTIYFRYLSLLKEAHKISKKVRESLEDMNKPLYEDPFSSDSDREDKDQEAPDINDQEQALKTIYMVNLVSAETGGFRAVIQEDKKAMDLLLEAQQKAIESQNENDEFLRINWQLQQIKPVVKPQNQLVEESKSERDSAIQIDNQMTDELDIMETDNQLGEFYQNENRPYSQQNIKDPNPFANENIPIRLFSGDPKKSPRSPIKRQTLMGNLQEVQLDESNSGARHSLIQIKPLTQSDDGSSFKTDRDSDGSYYENDGAGSAAKEKSMFRADSVNLEQEIMNELYSGLAGIVGREDVLIQNEKRLELMEKVQEVKELMREQGTTLISKENTMRDLLDVLEKQKSGEKNLSPSKMVVKDELPLRIVTGSRDSPQKANEPSQVVQLSIHQKEEKHMKAVKNSSDNVIQQAIQLDHNLDRLQKKVDLVENDQTENSPVILEMDQNQSKSIYEMESEQASVHSKFNIGVKGVINSSRMIRENSLGSLRDDSSSHRQVLSPVMLRTDSKSVESRKSGVKPIEHQPSFTRMLLIEEEKKQEEGKKDDTKIDIFEDSESEEPEQVAPLSLASDLRTLGHMMKRQHTQGIYASETSLLSPREPKLRATGSTPQGADDGNSNGRNNFDYSRNISNQNSLKFARQTTMNSHSMANIHVRKPKVGIPEATSELDVDLAVLPAKNPMKRFMNQSIRTDQTGRAIAGFPVQEASSIIEQFGSPLTHSRSVVGKFEKPLGSKNHTANRVKHFEGSGSMPDLHQIREIDRHSNDQLEFGNVANNYRKKLSRQQNVGLMSPELNTNGRHRKSQEFSPQINEHHSSVGGGRSSLLGSQSKLETESVGRLTGQLIMGSVAQNKRFSQLSQYEETPQKGREQLNVLKTELSRTKTAQAKGRNAQ